jgi:hypothetical protein
MTTLNPGDRVFYHHPQPFTVKQVYPNGIVLLQEPNPPAPPTPELPFFTTLEYLTTTDPNPKP